jgi:hypothetical protein
MLLQPFPVRPGQTNSHCLNDGKVRTLADRNASFLGVGRGLHHFNDEGELRAHLAYCREQQKQAEDRWASPDGTFADKGDADRWVMYIAELLGAHGR